MMGEGGESRHSQSKTPPIARVPTPRESRGPRGSGLRTILIPRPANHRRSQSPKGSVQARGHEDQVRGREREVPKFFTPQAKGATKKLQGSADPDSGPRQPT